ncbi:sodium channel protein Nach-like [Phlebotomus argentipes]|uniref:sodium channel protein Nach-like n=1 Tax=Phlebotomus argentipes TaxID=94469 RepID=UPI002892FC8D|nr:sodium channel protein Nach-like [Phlebotomus argentipes]
MATFPAKAAKSDQKFGKAVKMVLWSEKPRQQKRDETRDSIFVRYCDNTSVHGIRYLSEKGLHWTERLTWGIIVGMATFGVIYVSILLSEKYQTSPLSTVVEDTNFHISEIPFPGIAICNSHRINTRKVDDAIKRYLPNGTKEDILTFELLLNALEILDFGSYEEFESLLPRNISNLMGINITKLIIELRYTCQDLFKECWWRSKSIPCCDIFKMDEELKLWRTTSYNEWSGFRGVIQSYHGRVRRYTYPVGVLVIVHHPYEWPQQAKFIPEGTSVSIGIQPTAFYASSDVRRLTSTERQCIYKEDISHREEIMKLRALPYLRANCMSECRQRAMMAYCNCTLDFFYPSGIYAPCNIGGLVCLNRYNECSRIDYSVELFENLGMETTDNSVALDIHFKSSTMLRYRTDVTFGWLDLMVAFGGIAGLFLGCSLLSGAELVYYLTIGLFWHNTNPQQHRPPQHAQRPRINTISHGIEHVQQQWRLAKGNMFIVEASYFQSAK